MENELKLFELMTETLNDLDSRIYLLYDRISTSSTVSNEVKNSMLASLGTLNASKTRLIGTRDTLLTRFGRDVLDPNHPKDSLLDDVLNHVILDVEKTCGLDILPKEAEVIPAPQAEEKTKEQKSKTEKKEIKKPQPQKKEEKKPPARNGDKKKKK